MDEITEYDHLESMIHRAVSSALRGEPEVDLYVNDALAILDHLKETEMNNVVGPIEAEVLAECDRGGYTEEAQQTGWNRFGEAI